MTFVEFIEKYKGDNNYRYPHVFISGAITERLETYREYFNKAEKYIKGLGVKEIYNPSHININTPWEVAMEQTLAALLDADCIYVLKNWENSKGTKMEIEKAKELGVPVFFE